jgi:diguanylate cyclase (GGDEF)-like protein/PAS domain S-box-containing protein
MPRALDFAAAWRALRARDGTAVIGPLAGLIAAALMIIGAAVYLGGARQDTIQRASEERIVASTLRALLRGTAANARDYAWWDEAVRHLVLGFDTDWADANIEPLHSSLGYDAAFALAGDGRTVYGRVGPEPAGAEARAVLGPGLDRLIAKAGETPEGEPLPAAAVLEGPDGLFVAAVSPIVPQDPIALPLPAGPRSMLVVGKLLDERFLAGLEQDFGLGRPRIVAAGEGAALAGAEMAGPDGEPIGRIAWEPQRPGSRQHVWLIPALLGSLAVFAGFTRLVLRNMRRSTAVIRASEARYRAVVEDQAELICRYRPDTTLTFVNDAFCRYFGQSADELVGRSFLDSLPTDERPAAATRIAALQPGEAVTHEHQVFRPDGTAGWHQWTDRALGSPVSEYQGVGRDVTAQREAEEAARAAAERTALALTAGGMGTWEWDALTDRLAWDAAECRLFAIEPSAAPATVGAFLGFVHPGDRARLEQVERPNGPFEDEYRVLRPDGTVRWLVEKGLATRDATGRLVRMVGVNYDITERKAAEEQVRELALTDPLTGLPNRRALQELLARELARAQRGGPAVGLLLIDLDDFKRVNDTLGHSAGDALLAEAARRLRTAVREGDLVARIGGDEFAVLASAAGSGSDSEFAALADRAVRRLMEPFRLCGGDDAHEEAWAGASAGLAVFPRDAVDAEALLAHADIALYAAKAAGRGTWRPFRPAMQERLRLRAALDRDLRLTLERGGLELHYQPVVEVEGLALRGLEALIRWRHPDQGVVPPSALLAAAERDRLLAPLTFWTVTQALRQVATWRAAGLAGVHVAVNLATTVLDGVAVAEHVEQRLEAEGLPPDALLVEVTEGAMADSRRAVTTLEALRALGVRVAVDDFGAGYSSLARLRDLPLDALKIDRAFLGTPGGKGEAILSAVVELARGLDVPTVVEGVETIEQLALLRRIGATCAQGYLLARPMAPQDVPAWAGAWREGRSHDPRLDLLLRRVGGE